MEIDELADSTRRAFEAIHRRSFLGDPAANPKLRVEVVAPAIVADVATMVLITPWTLNGLMFVTGNETAAELVVAERRLPVFSTDVEELGPVSSVNLVADVSALADQAAARAAAAVLVEPFRAAVERAHSARGIEDPGRRELFRRLSGEG